MTMFGFAPQAVTAAAMGQKMPQQAQREQPEAAFQYGAGGQRMTPEDIARLRARAGQMQAAGMDFSPVGHWTQGLARVAQGLVGALEARRADKAADANKAESDAVLKALMGGGDPTSTAGAGGVAGASVPGTGPDQSALISAMMNPYVSDQVRSLAEMRYKAMQPKQTQPYRFEDNAGNQWEIGPDGTPKRIFTDVAEKQFIQDGRLVTVPNPFKPQVAQSTGPQPGTIEDGYEFLGGNPADKNNWKPVAADGGNVGGNVITQQMFNGAVSALGPDGAKALMARNNMTIGGQ